MESTLKRTWAEVDLDAIAHNYDVLRRRMGENVKFLGVVKAGEGGRLSGRQLHRRGHGTAE